MHSESISLLLSMAEGKKIPSDAFFAANHVTGSRREESPTLKV